MHHRRSNERVHLSCVEFDGETSLVIYYYTAMSAWEVAVKDPCFVFNTFSAIRLKSCLTGFVWLTFRSRLWNENCLKSECTRKKGKLILTQEKLLKYAQKREHRRKRQGLTNNCMFRNTLVSQMVFSILQKHQEHLSTQCFQIHQKCFQWFSLCSVLCGSYYGCCLTMHISFSLCRAFK